MLRHGHSISFAPGLCGVGSASVPGCPTVCEGRVAGSGGAGFGGYAGDSPPLVSRLARQRARGAQSGGPRGAQAQARAEAVGDDRAGAARGPACVRIQHGSLDVAPGGGGHRATDAGAPSSRACVAHPAWLELVPAAAGTARPGARRGGDRAVEDATVDAAKKNARRQRAWLVFEDESGVSQQPVVRRTWAPRGQTPVLIHTGGHWKRLSVAGALAFRSDGCSMRRFFSTQAGTYTDIRLITFLRSLKRHFRRQRVILIWDGLGVHKSRRMKEYVARQRAWLTVERLPAYAPELNPIEQVWGNVKTRELANVCAPDLASLRRPLRCGFARIRQQPTLARAFLRHAGLSFRHGF